MPPKGRKPSQAAPSTVATTHSSDAQPPTDASLRQARNVMLAATPTLRTVHRSVRRFYGLLQHYVVDPGDFPFVDEWIGPLSEADLDAELEHDPDRRGDIQMYRRWMQDKAMLERDAVEALQREVRSAVEDPALSPEARASAIADATQRQRELIVKRAQRASQAAEKELDLRRAKFAALQRSSLEHVPDDDAIDPNSSSGSSDDAADAALARSVDAMLAKLFLFVRSCVSERVIPPVDDDATSALEADYAATAELSGLLGLGRRATPAKNANLLDAVLWPRDQAALEAIAQHAAGQLDGLGAASMSASVHAVGADNIFATSLPDLGASTSVRPPAAARRMSQSAAARHASPTPTTMEQSRSVAAASRIGAASVRGASSASHPMHQSLAASASAHAQSVRSVSTPPAAHREPSAAAAAAAARRGSSPLAAGQSRGSVAGVSRPSSHAAAAPAAADPVPQTVHPAVASNHGPPSAPQPRTVTTSTMCDARLGPDDLLPRTSGPSVATVALDRPVQQYHANLFEQHRAATEAHEDRGRWEQQQQQQQPPSAPARSSPERRSPPRQSDSPPRAATHAAGSAARVAGQHRGASSQRRSVATRATAAAQPLGDASRPMVDDPDVETRLPDAHAASFNANDSAAVERHPRPTLPAVGGVRVVGDVDASAVPQLMSMGGVDLSAVMASAERSLISANIAGRVHRQEPRPAKATSPGARHSASLTASTDVISLSSNRPAGRRDGLTVPDDVLPTAQGARPQLGALPMRDSTATLREQRVAAARAAVATAQAEADAPRPTSPIEPWSAGDSRALVLRDPDGAETSRTSQKDYVRVPTVGSADAAGAVFGYFPLQRKAWSSSEPKPRRAGGPTATTPVPSATGGAVPALRRAATPGNAARGGQRVTAEALLLADAGSSVHAALLNRTAHASSAVRR